jgi:hypothetical protein
MASRMLLFINPKREPRRFRRFVYFTVKLALNMRNATNYRSYRGWHECSGKDCGLRSSTSDLLLPNGMITNTLALHYLEYHRSEMPWSELYKNLEDAI